MDSLPDRRSAVFVWVSDTTQPMWGWVTLAQAHTLPLLRGWAQLPNFPTMHPLKSLHSNAIKPRFLHKQVSELLPLSKD